MYQQYFQHDYFSRLDPKIRELRSVYGVKGYGIFWVIVEYIHEYGGELPVKRLADIADEIHEPVEEIESIVNDFGLFLVKNGKVTSKRIKQNFQQRKDVSEKRRKAANARWEAGRR